TAEQFNAARSRQQRSERLLQADRRADSSTCYAIKSYIFEREDGNAPVPVATTPCTPAHTLRLEQADRPPQIRLAPANGSRGGAALPFLGDRGQPGLFSISRYISSSPVLTNPSRWYSRAAGLLLSTCKRTGIIALRPCSASSRTRPPPMPWLRCSESRAISTSVMNSLPQ